MRCWCQNTAHSCPISGLLNSCVLAPVWCRSAYTRLIDSVLNDALPASHSNKPLTYTFRHPASLALRLEAILSLTYRGSLDIDYILNDLLSGSSDARQERLRFRRSFVPAARNLLNSLAGLSIRFSQWRN